MAVTIAVRFPHGQYHATHWSSAPNAGDTEWPPSPWRLSRAVLATWYSKGQNSVAETALTEVLTLFATPPEYWLPAATAEHTRHYMPQAAFKEWEEKRETTLIFDPSLHVDPASELLVRWPDTEPSSDATGALGDLLESLPYLGRAESVCEARLVNEDEFANMSLPELGWCRPAHDGGIRVLCPSPEVTRQQLECLPDELRAKKLKEPPGSVWVAYQTPVRSPRDRAPRQAAREARRAPERAFDVIRWRVVGNAPLRAQFGLYATEMLRRSRLLALGERDDADERLTGHRARGNGSHGAPVRFDGHESAHWLWLESAGGECFSWSRQPDTAPPVRDVSDLVLWVPRAADESDARVLTAQRIAAIVAGHQGRPGLIRFDGPQPRGYVPADLHLVSMGTTEEAIPELVSMGSTEWVSATPYLVTRHRKRGQQVRDVVREDICREVARRPMLGGAEVVDVQIVDDEYPVRWSAAYARRRRSLNSRVRAQRGIPDSTYQVMVRVCFDRPVNGPVSLGSLNHFGFGLFVPMG